MYSTKNNLILGFHGCKKEILDSILTLQSEMKPSHNDYDWLGSGLYFWENNYERAKQWAEEHYGENAAVLGAVFHLGKCLDFLDAAYLRLLKPAYDTLNDAIVTSGYGVLPKNSSNQFGTPTYRKLDCAVINLIIKDATRQNSPFDSVRGVFWEGAEAYPNAGFKEKNHIQVNIINPDCIKGFFLPRQS
ncbi:MAG: hypothetical protein EOM45_13915 [Clostridia bacterium]|nr:hypothetical protein [Clostridia bacterium]